MTGLAGGRGRSGAPRRGRSRGGADRRRRGAHTCRGCRHGPSPRRQVEDPQEADGARPQAANTRERRRATRRRKPVSGPGSTHDQCGSPPATSDGQTREPDLALDRDQVTDDQGGRPLPGGHRPALGRARGLGEAGNGNPANRSTTSSRLRHATGTASFSRKPWRQRSVTSTALNVYRCMSDDPARRIGDDRRQPLEQPVRPVEPAGTDQPGDELRVLDEEPMRVGDPDAGADREQPLRLGDARQPDVDGQREALRATRRQPRPDREPGRSTAGSSCSSRTPPSPAAPRAAARRR